MWLWLSLSAEALEVAGSKKFSAGVRVRVMYLMAAMPFLLAYTCICIQYIGVLLNSQLRIGISISWLSDSSQFILSIFNSHKWRTNKAITY